MDDAANWRTPSAEEVGPRPETLEAEDGGPPVVGRRIYRNSPTGRRYNTQQTVGLQAELFTNEASPVWPTPRTKQGHTYRQHAADGRQGLTLEGRAERWGTPQVGDATGTSGGAQEKSLRTDVRLWSTPRSEEREQRNSANVGIALSRQVKLWPTPQASEERHAGPSDDSRRADTLTKNAEDWPTPRAIYSDHPGMEDAEHLTGRAIEFWRTPDASPQKTDFSATDAHKGRPTTSSQATNWATPTSHDHKDGTGGDLATKALLSRQAPRSGLPVPGSGASGAGSSSVGPNSPRPRLNPAFVEWLVGVPVGWTDFEPLGISWSRSSVNSR